VSIGRVVQINVSPGGVPKLPVAAVRVTLAGPAGDGHRDMEHHGGPERAVCLYALEAIEILQAEGHPIVPGSIGENLTIQGLDWTTIVPGTILGVGEQVLLQVTRYTSPCVNIRPAFLDGDYSRVSQKRNPGWSRVYARVLSEGAVRPGDAVRVLPPAEADAGLAPGPR
jgi:MOSC domain-containing protein YiiM